MSQCLSHVKQTIVNCFLSECNWLKICLHRNSSVRCKQRLASTLCKRHAPLKESLSILHCTCPFFRIKILPINKRFDAAGSLSTLHNKTLENLALMKFILSEQLVYISWYKCLIRRHNEVHAYTVEKKISDILINPVCSEASILPLQLIYNCGCYLKNVCNYDPQ